MDNVIGKTSSVHMQCSVESGKIHIYRKLKVKRSKGVIKQIGKKETFIWQVGKTP